PQAAGKDERVAPRPHTRSSYQGRLGVLSPAASPPPSKPSAPAPIPTTADRPTRAPSGTRASFPTTVSPSIHASAGSAGAAPKPTSAPAPSPEYLPRIARDTRAPAPITTSSITTASAPSVPASSQ